MSCVFCEIANKNISATILHETKNILVFLDRSPIREGHAQIITKSHYETFEVTPPELISEITQTGQKLAKRLKQIYSVDRVAFLFTGGDVAHTHAHVVPMVGNLDITSIQYITSPDHKDLVFNSEHLLKNAEELNLVKEKIGAFH